ncbi:MAG: SUF system Fe-S cluster assembly protein [Pseudomonadota bacterium]
MTETTETTRDLIDLDPPTPAAPGPGVQPDQETLDRMTVEIVKALKSVYDPEIPVDIYELGLIYQVDYDEGDEGGLVKVEMTLTAPGCPVAGEMPGWVQQAVERVDGVARCDVTMTFEPPWGPDKMSDEAKLELGWM